jgi:hypothetical protein
VFDLRNSATVKLSSVPRVLSIRGGGRVGHGTMNGNLVIGYSDGTLSQTTVAPGHGMDDIGTPTVTLSMHIINAYAYTHFDIRCFVPPVHEDP